MTQKLLNKKRFFLVLIILVVSVNYGFSQQPATNLDLLARTICSGCNHHTQNVDFMQTRSGSLIARYNPVSLAFTGLMYVYQRFVSPQTPSKCIYETSCSHFSKILIAEYGLIRGIVFTADRLMRCNRVAATDVNPSRINEQSGKVIETVEIYQLPK